MSKQTPGFLLSYSLRRGPTGLGIDVNSTNVIVDVLAGGAAQQDGNVMVGDVIEVVDRPKLARSLSAEMARQGRHLPCYVQVNTGEEDQKSGIWPEEADDFIVFCWSECGLDIAGLMCIPPVEEEPAMHFALLRTIAERNGLSGLSMGMSGDYEEAVRFGATSVRVGSAIFGSRDS